MFPLTIRIAFTYKQTDQVALVSKYTICMPLEITCQRLKNVDSTLIPSLQLGTVTLARDK